MKVKIRVAAKFLFVALGLMAATQACALVTGIPHTIRGARSDSASKKLGAPSLTGDSTVVGTVDYDADGNVVVKWGPNRFVIAVTDSIAPKDYSSEQEFLKKFQKQDVQEDSDGEGYSLLFPGADGKVGRIVVVRRTETGMSITAVDIGQKKKAEEEQVAIDSADAL